MTKERKDDRASAAYHAEIRRRGTNEIVGHLADISAGGFMLTSEQALTVGERLELAIELPRGSEIGEALPVDAKVRWCEADMAPGVFTAGLEYTADDERAQRIHQHLQRLLGQGR